MTVTENILYLPATTPASIVWKELWKAGLDVRHPKAGETLAAWFESLPAWTLKRITRLAGTDRQANKDSTHKPTQARYSP